MIKISDFSLKNFICVSSIFFCVFFPETSILFVTWRLAFLQWSNRFWKFMCRMSPFGRFGFWLDLFNYSCNFLFAFFNSFSHWLDCSNDCRGNNRFYNSRDPSPAPPTKHSLSWVVAFYLKISRSFVLDPCFDNSIFKVNSGLRSKSDPDNLSKFLLEFFNADLSIIFGLKSLFSWRKLTL